MTIRILADPRRRYTKGDFAPLARHYAERVFQVHVMNEYARQALVKLGQALALVMAYFSQNKRAFVERYFAGRTELLERATSEQSFQRLVEDLANPAQAAVVAAGEGESLLVLAGPGSGKTRVVAHRTAYLLRVRRVRPEAILVLTFNRHAAVSLRRRLLDLVGDEARGVTIQTYHGLALRLTGRSLAAHRDRHADTSPDFDTPLEEAIALLQGGRDLPGLPAAEARERLLAASGSSSWTSTRTSTSSSTSSSPPWPAAPWQIRTAG
ncbi:MAG: UvrD-helicase domain-containing protein [Thermodesulfobacteriota bacterium]